MNTMNFTIWYVMLGAVFLFMGVGNAWVKRMPITTSLLYIFLGIAIGPLGLKMLEVDPIRDSRLLEILSEITVIVSLFSAGLKLRVPFADKRWRLSINLAFISMTITVVLIATLSHFMLSLPWDLAILAGAMLAPTDPVLASDVQVTSPKDQDHLRFALTAEAGMNDGTAFPFVMLGLGLMGHHSLGYLGMNWLARDILWPLLGGLAIGASIGFLIAILARKIRRTSREPIILDDFLVLALISLSYGVALACHTYGFLAVFSAAVTIRQLELVITSQTKEITSAEMAEAVLIFNEQMERICEVVFVITLGSMLSLRMFSQNIFFFASIIFMIIRPLSVYLGTFASQSTVLERSLISWFGIRGIGSIYYLMFALQHGLKGPNASQIVDLVLAIVAISVVIHGISVTPLMNRYQRGKFKKSTKQKTPKTG